MEKSHKALEKILAESELKELWEETEEYGNWVTTITELQFIWSSKNIVILEDSSIIKALIKLIVDFSPKQNPPTKWWGYALL